ncbi:MAG: hypothetical protein K0R48_839 [Gammaproteobacteria bacterium]|jgi:hypothetical protein|nr:hypothetical protein [Gammaproteobacteria bacterium]
MPSNTLKAKLLVYNHLGKLLWHYFVDDNTVNLTLTLCLSYLIHRFQ